MTEYEYRYEAPDELRCPSREGGGVQCIHFADTPHNHEVRADYFGGKPKVIAQRLKAGAWHEVESPHEH